MSTVRARLAIALAGLAACAALAACGGGDDGTTANDAGATSSTASAPAGSSTTTQASGEDSTTTQASGEDSTATHASGEDSTTTQESGEDKSGEDSGLPESHIAPDAEVAAGLKRLKGVGATVAATGGGDEARDAVERVWQPIEGTVKRNEPDLYLDVEDSFELLSSGDPGKARQGRQRLDEAVDAYLAKHPG